MSECLLNKDPVNGTCFSDENARLITKAVGVSTIAEAKKKLSCSTDACVVASAPNLEDDIRHRIDNLSLKPYTSSYDGSHWLSNTEIDSCMSQLYDQFPGFGYGFIHMVDNKMFPPNNVSMLGYEVHPVTRLDFAKEFANGGARTSGTMISTKNNAPLTSYGVVFNTDTSDGSGQHWYAVYISTDQVNGCGEKMITIELFNSSGNEITYEEFNKFWTKTALDIAECMNIDCEYKLISRIKHQSDTTGNCGAYSLFYIYARLNNISPDEFNKPDSAVRDTSMESFRKYLFRTHDQIL
jgi:hypothetical protein